MGPQLQGFIPESRFGQGCLESRRASQSTTELTQMLDKVASCAVQHPKPLLCEASDAGLITSLLGSQT